MEPDEMTPVRRELQARDAYCLDRSGMWMAECLKLLGFKRDENPTGTDRTRTWRFTGTDGTESAQGFVSAEKPRVANVQLISNTDTQTKRAVWVTTEEA